MGDTKYADLYRNIDFREHPERYVVGKGEQGVLIAEPYKSEILPHWRFKTPQEAEASATQIYTMFQAYGREKDFVGMDMARKFLQMGFTRSRRYANHPAGIKYDGTGALLPQAADALSSAKAESAKIFREFYVKARTDQTYRKLLAKHRQLSSGA